MLVIRPSECVLRAHFLALKAEGRLDPADPLTGSAYLFPIPHTTRRANYRTKRRKKRLEERQRQALAWALKHEGIDYTNAYGVDDPVPLLAMRNIVAEGRRLG